MLNMLFKFIFELITKLADIIVTPLITAITTLIPSTSARCSFNISISYYDI